MPAKIERALERAAEAKGFKKGSDRYNRYVHGTLARLEIERRLDYTREKGQHGRA